MAVHAVVIKYSGNKHCFLTIDQRRSTSNNIEDINQIPVYRCEYDEDRVAYLSVLNHIPLTITQDLLYLNGLYAQKIGIKDEDQVVLQLIGQTPLAVSVETEPVSTDDWEIVEKYADVIEERLMDQVRVIWKDQIIPVWVDKAICIFLRIDKITPDEECVVLGNDTEVMVAPKLFTAKGKQPQVRDKSHKRRHSDPQITNSLAIPTIGGADNGRVTKSRSPNPRRRSDKNRPSKANSFGIESTSTRPELKRQPSVIDKVMRFGWLTKWMGSIHYSNAENHSELSYMSENFVIKEHHMIFRVQSLKFSCNPEQLEIFKGTDPNPYNQCHSFEVLEPSQDEELPPLELFQPSTIFVNHRDVMKILDGGTKKSLPSVFYAELRKLKSPKETGEEKRHQPATPPTVNASDKKRNSKEDNSKEEGSSQCCIVRIVTVDKTTDLSDERWQLCAERILDEQTLLSGHVLVPDILRRQMKLDVTGRLWLQTVQREPLTAITKLLLYPLTVVPRFVNDTVFKKAFKKFIEWVANDDHPMVVFQGMLIKFMVTEGVHIEAQMVFEEPTPGDRRQKYMLLSQSNLSEIPIEVQRTLKDEHLICPQLPYSHVQDFDPIAPDIRLSDLGAVSNMSEKAIRHLETCLLPKPLSEHLFSSCLGLNHGILLISGPKGCGKSSLAQAICRRMAEVPNMVFTASVDCKSLRGKRVDKIQETFELLFDEAAWRQPSIVLLEDLHIVAGAANSPDAEITGEAIYTARVAEVLTNIIKYLIKNNTKVAIIATSLSQSSLHPNLVTSRGIHFIQEVIAIRPPKKEERKQIFTKMLQTRLALCKNLAEKIDIDHIVNKTEGYVARDLEIVIDRAIHAKCLVDWKACSAGDIQLSDEEFLKALDGYKPTSFRNVSLHVGEISSWEDVGGMKNIKDILIETLQWPTKYPALFANCPLRLRTGLLLYGAPGTGKTLIAGVVAKECGLNFISVKGPEVLSKYIGASEQAVRDLFIRAQSAKPCILFFDEFDSMAPRRGHDNTGVTDRVVNQLLTQLDGVEGLDGVYVLAATSRPDLIDGALLRPGRIDKCLHCGLPTEEERVEILEALSSKMSLHQDVDLELIAKKSEYFTGADLKAVLYNAQLEAIHATTGFSLDDSFNDRATKKSLVDECKDNVMTEEMKTAIQKVKEGNYEIQAVEKAAVLRQTSSMSENLNCEEKKMERPASFHGDMASFVQPIEDRVVTMIPKLHDGIRELTNEEEEKILNMIRGLQRRTDLQKKAKSERRGSVHGGREQMMIQVNQDQLLRALRSTRPSVSEEERLRYQYIYDTFTSSRSGNFNPAITKAGQIATMA